MEWSEIYYTPKIDIALISLSVAHKKGIRHHSNDAGEWIFTKDGEPIITAKPQDQLFVIEVVEDDHHGDGEAEPSQALATTSQDLQEIHRYEPNTITELHELFGHQNARKLMKAV